jgi:hypothetical protein
MKRFLAVLFVGISGTLLVSAGCTSSSSSGTDPEIRDKAPPPLQKKEPGGGPKDGGPKPNPV